MGKSMPNWLTFTMSRNSVEQKRMAFMVEVEVEVAVQQLYRFLYKKLLLAHFCRPYVVFFQGREKSFTRVLKIECRGNSSTLFFRG